MGVEIEAQNESEVRQIKARETQLENMERLNDLTETINDINIDNIEYTTNDIKDLLVTNLDEQTNLDDIFDAVKDIAKEISSIKKSQTNVVKKVNSIEKQVKGDK